VLAAARGHPNARIVAGLGVSVDTGPQVAGPVRRPRPRRAGRPAPARPAPADQRGGPDRGGRAGLPAARRHRARDPDLENVQVGLKCKPTELEAALDAGSA
jgi:hypothetical protein